MVSKKKPLQSEYFTNNPAVAAMLDKVRKIAETALPVLITGETGSGKTELARYIHFQSSRKQEPFVHINCAAIPEHLIEAELFGVIKGAFTGAYKDNAGKFFTAKKGTILLDEIGEIPMHLQAKLLKVVDEKEYYPVGSAISEKIHARIIAATNTDITRAVKDRKFRRDLYFRLNTFELYLPPLRDRTEDITLFFNLFIKRYAEQKKTAIPEINTLVYDVLAHYTWPGNIREVQNVVEVLMISGKKTIEVSDLPLAMFDSAESVLVSGASEFKTLDEIKKDYTKYIYKISENNKKQTARILKADIKTVRRLLK